MIIRYILTGVVCVIAVFQINSQTHVTIQANCREIFETDQAEIMLLFVEDKTKCDPEIGFISLEQLQSDFEESIDVRGIDFSEFKPFYAISDRKPNNRYFAMQYRADTSKVLQVKEIALNLGITIKSLSKYSKKQPLSNQDEYAVCALDLCNRRAQALADAMSYGNVELVAVDDLTSSTNFRQSLMFMLEAIKSSGLNAGTDYAIKAHYVFSK